MKYYTLDRILETKADYNIIFGERSNGKTTAVLWYGLQNYINSGYIDQLAIIRRWDEDFKGKGNQIFDGIINLGWIEQATKGLYNSIISWSRKWYLAKFNKDGEKVKVDENPFAFGFSISAEEHYKSTSFPNITTVLFDEFITRNIYIPDEFIKFQSVLSTIIRLRNNVKIFMCGNTVNKYNPYFSEMGLTNAKNMKIGTIDIYTYGDTSLKVAVEYCDNGKKSKKESNKYFAFNNPKLKMITEGSWEIDIYPHLPTKYTPKDVIYKYYIQFNNDTVQCNIIQKDNEVFTFIHRKTTEIKDDGISLIYNCVVSHKNNRSTDITRPRNKQELKIYSFFKENRVFYQDNEIGEIVSNYIKWCITEHNK